MGRQLTFQGKASVINALALSQIWHLCHVFVIPDWAKRRITKAIWNFFWSGRRDLVARHIVCLPKAKGGFGVADFSLKAESFAIQWIKRYFTLSPAKWKAFFSFYLLSCLSSLPIQAFSSESFPRRLINLLPPYYQLIVRAWYRLDGGLHAGLLSLCASSPNPRPLADLNSHVTYVIGRNLSAKEPHCMSKFRPKYGDLYWPQTWDQIHLTSMDREVVDLNWKIAHGVLYTASRLVTSFGMANIDIQCHCRADEETLEHLFFECRYARLMVAWVHFHLLLYNEAAASFTVQELLFGFSKDRRKGIPKVIMWMLQVVKHRLWVARCDFRFRNTLPTEAECLKVVIARVKFLLRVHAGRCRTPAQVRDFEKEWLANKTLGHFEGEKLVFSF